MQMCACVLVCMCVFVCVGSAYVYVFVYSMPTMYVWEKYAESEGEIRHVVGGGREVNEHWWNEGA